MRTGSTNKIYASHLPSPTVAAAAHPQQHSMAWSAWKLATAVLGLCSASRGLGAAATWPDSPVTGLAVPLTPPRPAQASAALGQYRAMLGPAWEQEAISLGSKMGDDVSRTLARRLLGKPSGQKRTYIFNASDQDLRVTLGYRCFQAGSDLPDFKDRIIPTQQSDYDSYNIGFGPKLDPACGGRQATVIAEIGIRSAKNHGNFEIDPNDSLIITKRDKLPGLNVWKSKPGKPREWDDKGTPLGQIYDN